MPRARLTVKDLRRHEGRLVPAKVTAIPEQRPRLTALLARIEADRGLGRRGADMVAQTPQPSS